MNAQSQTIDPEVNVNTIDEIDELSKEFFSDEPEATVEQAVRYISESLTDEPENLLELVSQARDDLFETWHKSWNDKTEEEHEQMKAAREGWLRKIITAGYREDGISGIPTYRELKKRQKAIFGSAASNLTDIRHQCIDAVDEEEDETPWYEERGYSHESVMEGVGDGQAFYKDLTDEQVAAIHEWVIENGSNPPSPPSKSLLPVVKPLGGRQIMFGTVMKLCGINLTSADARRCYIGMTDKALGTYVLRIVEDVLDLAAADEMNLLYRAGALDDLPPEAGEEPQPKPREQSLAERKLSEEAAGWGMPLADEPEVDEEGVEDPSGWKVQPVPLMPEQTTRMHPDDRAVLVAELRAAITADNAELINEVKSARQAVEQAKAGMGTIAQRLETLADGIVAIRQKVEGRNTVRLDAESMQAIEQLHGLHDKIMDGISKLRTSAKPGAKPSDIADLISSGRGFTLTVQKNEE